MPNLPPTRNMLKLKRRDCGLKCPACGAQSAVNQTKDEGYVIKRSRGCSSCGYRFRTIESISPIHPSLSIDLSLTG